MGSIITTSFMKCSRCSICTWTSKTAAHLKKVRRIRSFPRQGFMMPPVSHFALRPPGTPHMHEAIGTWTDRQTIRSDQISMCAAICTHACIHNRSFISNIHTCIHVHASAIQLSTLTAELLPFQLAYSKRKNPWQAGRKWTRCVTAPRR